MRSRTPVPAPDFGDVWRAARVLLDGRNPYDVPAARAFLYPLPAAVVGVPLAWLGLRTASAVFFNVSTALLAFGLTLAGWWRLCVLLSPPFALSLYVVQWPPVLMAAALLPGVGGLAVVKPNVGIITFLYRPSWPAFSAGCSC